MQSPQQTPTSLLDYPRDNSRRRGEMLRAFWESNQPVQLLWLGQVGQILLQLLFFALFLDVIGYYLPTMAEPQGNITSELFLWCTALLPLFSPVVLVPFSIWRIYAGWVSGARWKPILLSIGLAGTSATLGFFVLLTMIINFD